MYLIYIGHWFRYLVVHLYGWLKKRKKKWRDTTSSDRQTKNDTHTQEKGEIETFLIARKWENHKWDGKKKSPMGRQELSCLAWVVFCSGLKTYVVNQSERLGMRGWCRQIDIMNKQLSFTRAYSKGQRAKLCLVVKLPYRQSEKKKQLQNLSWDIS